MKFNLSLATVMLLGSMLHAQTPAPRRQGGFVPGQERPPGDPAQIAHGKALYGTSCVGCHGADLRGGDLGGPNLLRSQLALSDKDGELIVPVILGSRQNEGMPAIDLSKENAMAVAAYVRSVMATIGKQGFPPSIGVLAPTVLVGDAAAGKAYFAAKCGSCHSPTGDLEGIATRIPDAKTLQNRWVAGGARGRGAAAPSARPATVTVTMPSGEKVNGKLRRIDDFLVSLTLPDGSVRTIRRDGDVPKVEVHDLMKAHRDLLTEYTDKQMHDITAYLVSLK